MSGPHFSPLTSVESSMRFGSASMTKPRKTFHVTMYEIDSALRQIDIKLSYLGAVSPGEKIVSQKWFLVSLLCRLNPCSFSCEHAGGQVPSTESSLTVVGRVHLIAGNQSVHDDDIHLGRFGDG